VTPASGSEQHHDRRAELVAVAAEIINERGVDAARLSDVAARAGVSVGLLQHYFGSRDSLMREAFEIAVVGDFEDLLVAQREIDDPWDRIDAIITELVAPAAPVKEARNWVDLCAAASRDPELRPTVQDVQDRWIQLLERAIEDGARAGEFEPVLPPREIALAVNALCDGMVVALASGAPGSSALDAADMHAAVGRVARKLVGASEP
jgi:AcrR family transcriptional regulator